MLDKLIVLTLVPHYVPGYESGGPIRSVKNLVAHLGGQINFRIVTSDRDALGTQPYDSVEVDAWNRVGGAEVFYASPTNLSFGKLTRLIDETPHDVLYLNSFFHLRFTSQALIARRLGRLGERPVVIAPRGELSPGALAIKRWRKRIYGWLSKASGLYRDVTWQASSEHEASQIRRVMGSLTERVIVAPNLPPSAVLESYPDVARNVGRADSLRICFLSRIAPKKNLKFALKVLASVNATVDFNIVGPIRDKAYWRGCHVLIKELPDNVEATYRGSVPHREVEGVLAQHDLFFLPTRGENYGHAIVEALTVGTPVLIADTTPWRNLEEAGVGWDLSLDDFDGFVEAVESAALIGDEEYVAWRQRVRRFAGKHLVDPDVIEANRRLFMDLADSSNRRARHK